MGYSGARLYDDDTAADVRMLYRGYVADGATGDAATDTLVAEWADLLDDPDQACPFWLALADTQWRVGRLEDRVRERALAIISTGQDLARFDHDDKLRRRREAVLAQLRERLMSPQRDPVRIRRVFRSISPVGVGDVFSFAMKSGRQIYMRCVGIHGDAQDNSPIVELLDWARHDPPAGSTNVPALSALMPWPDLLCLVRDARDPDPAERIHVIARATPVARMVPFPAAMVRWADLDEAVQRRFGLPS